MDNNDSRDIAYLIVAAGGLLALNRLWALRIRPWLAQYIGILHDDAGAPALRLFRWQLSSVDLIATALIALCLFLLYRLTRSRLRAIARERHADGEGSRDPAGAPGRV